MAIIFKPRRSDRSKVSSGGTKASLVLEQGEMFFVKNDTAGSTRRYDVYVGDGSTQISSLSPALFGDTSEEDITLTDDASTTSTAALANIITGKKLGALIGSIKTAITTTKKESKNNYYGTCATAGATKDKVVTVSSDQNFVLQVGTMVAVKFSNTNSYSATSSNKITLNVNNTGAFNIWYYNTIYNTGTNTTAYGVAGLYNYYMYDGTYWVWAGRSLDGNDGNSNLRYNANIKAGTDAIVAGNIICASSSGLYGHLKLGNAFDIKWPILYANGAISASSTGTNNFLMYNVAVATTQSITLTAYYPVYIKGTLNNTTFTPISTAPLTQTVPSAVDNYHYLLLGIATSTTAFYLLEHHPIYKYDYTGFKIFEQTFAVNNNLANVDLNDVKQAGFYYLGGSHGCSNAPSGWESSGFGMEVIHCAMGNYYVQIAYNATGNKSFMRGNNNGTWSYWIDYSGQVNQSESTTPNWRKIVLGAQSADSAGAAVTDIRGNVYAVQSIEAQPSTGTLNANKFNIQQSATMQYNSDLKCIEFVFL